MVLKNLEFYNCQIFDKLFDRVNEAYMQGLKPIVIKTVSVSECKYKQSVKFSCIYCYSFLNNNKMTKYEMSSEYPIL